MKHLAYWGNCWLLLSFVNVCIADVEIINSSPVIAVKSKNVTLKCHITMHNNGDVLYWHRIITRSEDPSIVLLKDLVSYNSFTNDDFASATGNRYSAKIESVVGKPLEHFYILTIADIQEEDSGTFLCSSNEQNDTLHVEVIENPKEITLAVDGTALRNGEEIQLDKGDQYDIKCEVQGSNPAPEITVSLKQENGGIDKNVTSLFKISQQITFLSSLSDKAKTLLVPSSKTTAYQKLTVTEDHADKYLSCSGSVNGISTGLESSVLIRLREDKSTHDRAGSSKCKISLRNAMAVKEVIANYLANSVLIEYNLTFIENQQSNQALGLTLETSSGTLYKPYRWQRVFSSHGQTLLSLPFYYDILSLSLLSYGVEKLSVNITDQPEGCFGKLLPEEATLKLASLVLHDFNNEEQDIAKGNFACSKVIKQGEYGVANFVPHCCTLNSTKHWVCKDYQPGYWFTILFKIIPWVDYVVFFFLPAFALAVLTKRSYRTSNYIVKLDEPFTMQVEKGLQEEDGTDNREFEKEADNSDTTVIDKKSRKEKDEGTKEKRLCVENIKKLPYNYKKHVELSLLHVLVDHKKLMRENDVYISLFSFLWKKLVLCNLKNAFPFKPCCKQGLCGSWENKIFCARIPCQNRGCIKYLRYINLWCKVKNFTWNNVLKFLAFLFVLTFLVPLPYYIQCIVYWAKTGHEIQDMQEAGIIANNLHLNPPAYILVPPYYFIPFLPWHLAAMIVYLVTSFIILILYFTNKFDFVEYLVEIIRDFKHLERIEAFRLLAMHIVKPFEKFGCWGLVIGPFIWIFTIPFGLATIIFYTFPTCYLSGRLLFTGKPKFMDGFFCYKKTHTDRYSDMKQDEIEMKEKKVDSEKRNLMRSLSNRQAEKLNKEIPEIDSDEEMEIDEELENLNEILLLDKISPKNQEAAVIRPLDKDGNLITTPVGYTITYKVFMGFVILAFMISLLVIYSDFAGVLIEVITLTFMGAIANAGSVGQYFFFVFFVITYTKTVLNKVNDKYKLLSTELFTHIKSKLDAELNKTVIIRGEEQKNFAFKYFTSSELRELNDNRQLSILSDVQDDFSNKYKDKFKRVGNKMHLKLHSVILFLDKYDNPRIPIELFEKVCKLRCPGCPGPIYKSLLMAMKELSYLVLFLFFLMIVVMAFSNTYQVKTTNQLLLTVIGGFAPFVVRFVMKPKDLHINFSTYAFKSRVHEIISQFKQCWPVYDFEFEYPAMQPVAGDVYDEDKTYADFPSSSDNNNAAEGHNIPSVDNDGIKVNLHKIDVDKEDGHLIFKVKRLRKGDKELDLVSV